MKLACYHKLLKMHIKSNNLYFYTIVVIVLKNERTCFYIRLFLKTIKNRLESDRKYKYIKILTHNPKIILPVQIDKKLEMKLNHSLNLTILTVF